MQCACAGWSSLNLPNHSSSSWADGATSSSAGCSTSSSSTSTSSSLLSRAVWRRGGAASYHSGLHGGGSGSSGHAAVTHATTIIAVRKDGEVVVMGDGQATQDAFIVKANVTKVRRVADGVIGGFAGRAADGLSLLERLERKLEEHPGQLARAAVELAKDWRQDRVLRNLEALLLVADARTTLWVSGTGDVIEASEPVMGIGSGSDYAEAAARALLELPGLSAMSIAHKSMRIAADCCVYTNSNFRWQQITREGRVLQGRANAAEVLPAEEGAEGAAATSV